VRRVSIIRLACALTSAPLAANAGNPNAADNAAAMPAPGSGSGSDNGSLGSGSGSGSGSNKQTAELEPPSTANSITSVDASAPSPLPGVSLGDTTFQLHGYARMPLDTQGTREPWLVDNDPYLSGFSYTRLYEPDWSELYLSANRGDYKAEFGLFASGYSDYSQADNTTQLGIAQASVSAKNFLGQQGLFVQVGVFWDRFGYIEPYDTYIFGRTHQGGFKLRYELPFGGRVQAGVGFHQANLENNEGMTPIAHLAAAYPVGPVELGTYLLSTWTGDDKRPLLPIVGGTMYVAGADAKYKLPNNLGTSYLAFSYYDMNKVYYLADSLELMNSMGGRGLSENFLGTTSSDDGSGHMFVLASDNKFNITDKLRARVFGMATWVRSPQVDLMNPLDNYDRRLYFKWGVEPAYQITSKVYAALRFDRVILDVYDSANSFRVLSPRVGFPLQNWGELYMMYSHYWYGSQVQLRQGQVPGETMPDADAFKVQAQVRW
jgi:hypothetical protein